MTILRGWYDEASPSFPPSPLRHSRHRLSVMLDAPFRHSRRAASGNPGPPKLELPPCHSQGAVGLDTGSEAGMTISPRRYDDVAEAVWRHYRTAITILSIPRRGCVGGESPAVVESACVW